MLVSEPYETSYGDDLYDYVCANMRPVFIGNRPIGLNIAYGIICLGNAVGFII